MQALLAARDPTEVLHRVGHEDPLAVDAGVGQRAPQQLAGRADEGMALDVLAVARLLANQHDVRLGGAFAAHRLGRVRIEIAGRAVPTDAPQVVDRLPRLAVAGGAAPRPAL